MAVGLAAGARDPLIRVVSGPFQEVNAFDVLVGPNAPEMLEPGLQAELTVIEETLTVSQRGPAVDIVGEVRNEGQSTAVSLSIQFAALDDDGQLVTAGSGGVYGVNPADPAGYSFPDVVASGESGFFHVVFFPGSETVETILVRARGFQTDLEAGDPSLEMVGEWEAEVLEGLVRLRGIVLNASASDIVGLGVTVAARSPSGSMLAVGRSYPRADLIGGYLGGVRSEEETEVETYLAIDEADFETATLETRADGFRYTGGFFRYGVAGIAHSPGVDASVWRSSLGLTNHSGAPAGVTLTYFHSGRREDVSLEIANEQSIGFDDVVRSLFGVGGSSAGYVQIASSAPLMVTGRTSNETPTGGFGQALPIYTPVMTRELIAGGVLSSLRGGEAFRSNIGLVNMGNANCTCRVELLDKNGVILVDPGPMELAPTEWRQLNDVMPSGVEAAYATVEPDWNCWLWAYASVIEQATGDPTTVSVEPGVEIHLASRAPRGAGLIFSSWAEQESPEPPRP